MTPLADEWVRKAEADFGSAQREYRARKQPNYDLACFLAQQCAEKYLKARLQEATIPFPKTHDLVLLLDLILPSEPLWASLRPECKMLTEYGVAVRYPGFSADKAQAQRAIQVAKGIQTLARVALGLR